MFGINEITWADFSKFIILSLMVWYSLLIILGWFRSKQGRGQESFEEYQSGITDYETMQPFAVSSVDYPSEILPVNPAENEPLPASLYEETGYDEGLAIEHFTKKDSPVLAGMIPEIHHQQ